LATHCHQLTILDCTGLSTLTDALLLALGAHCHALSTLLLSWVTKLTDVGVVALGAGCPHLATLSLHGIVGVHDDGLRALAAGCAATLIALDVRGCANLAALRTPEQLLTAFPRLRTFVLHT
jgi:F-box/leucine-rich repeat protein 2/20